MAEPLVDYNTIQGNPENYSLAQLEMAISKDLAMELAKHYPHRSWAVPVDAGNGVCAVMEQNISKTKGYLIYLSRPMEEIRGMMKQIGGEILERAGVTTAKKVDLAEFENLVRDVRDDVVASDLEAPEDKRATE